MDETRLWVSAAAGEALCEKFYYCSTDRVMRPCVIVDYEWELYVCAVCGLPLNAMGGLP